MKLIKYYSVKTQCSPPCKYLVKFCLEQKYEPSKIVMKLIKPICNLSIVYTIYVHILLQFVKTSFLVIIKCNVELAFFVV